MKIVHIFSINSGGAAIAAKRIAKAVEVASSDRVKNEYLALYQAREDKKIIPFFKKSWLIIITRFMRKISEIIFEPRTKSYPGPFSLGNFGVASRNRIIYLLEDTDIIHIHWINRGFFSLRQVEKLVDFGIPVIWTMHDMWAFTGGCHYDGECGKYKEKCCECHCVIKGRNNFDKEQNKKKMIFSRKNVHFVGCSEWITECARKSYVLCTQKNIKCIPNPIDDMFLEKIDSKIRLNLRDKYNVPKEKNIVLFGAMDSDDERKGAKFIKYIVSNIVEQDFHLVVFGSCDDLETYKLKNITVLGSIADRKQMHEIYSMSDVFVAPSIQENLANTVVESLASGTPVVAFDIGGMRDMIIDKVNGRLVTPFRMDELVDAIKYSVEHISMRVNAQKSVSDKFSNEVVGRKYYKLYKEAIQDNRID